MDEGALRRGRDDVMDAPEPAAEAGSVAHYKKMYDRASALARIGVWECDLATEALTWTDGVYDLFELPRGAALERARIVDYYDEESRREMERLRAEAIRTGGSFSLDIHIHTAKGNARWLRLTADVEREHGRSVRIFGTKQDITAEKLALEKVRALQAELIHVSRTSAMGTMAAMLAHELNQPLAAIGNFAAGTRRALESEALRRDFLADGLDQIAKSALRASNIIRSLREMSGGGGAKRQRLDPKEPIAEAVALAILGVEDIALRLELADGLLVAADPIQLQQVVINLVRNAVEALKAAPRREIAVSLRAAGSHVELAVEDSGPGIPPGMMATLFEAFASSKPEGMGVGLSISRTIVEAHGGTLSAENHREGGARFRVTLPAATKAGKPA
jgi:C4-dicarboxylate-specific signal transduction histidine kinase